MFITVALNSAKHFPMKGYRGGDIHRKYLKKHKEQNSMIIEARSSYSLECKTDGEVLLLKMSDISLSRTTLAGKCLSSFH